MAVVKGRVVVGHSAPAVDGIKVLAIQVLAQAVRDARCRNPRQQRDAILWLNTPEGRDLAGALGVERWRNKREITCRDLPGQVRFTWFDGGAP